MDPAVKAETQVPSRKKGFRRNDMGKIELSLWFLGGVKMASRRV